MSDAFGAIFGGSRGAHHLRSDETLDSGRFRQRVRSLTANVAAGAATYATTLDQLVNEHRLSIVSCGLHGHTGPTDGELVIELAPTDALGEPTLCALLVLSQDARAQMASGRVFFLDHEFEVTV